MKYVLVVVLAVGCTSPASSPIDHDGAVTGCYPQVVQIETTHGDCTATLIGNDALLTAAHCLDPVAPESVTIRFGNDREQPERTPSVTSVVIPATERACRGDAELFPYIGEPTLPAGSVHDVAVVRFTPPIDGIAPARFANPPAPGQRIVGVGFGKTRDGRDDGKKRVGRHIVTSRDGATFEADGVDGGGYFSGDSGGPAFLATDDDPCDPANAPVLVGVLSSSGAVTNTASLTAVNDPRAQAFVEKALSGVDEPELVCCPNHPVYCDVPEGFVFSYYGRPMGECRLAARDCSADGNTLGECVGARVLPQQEICSNGLDDDCDGTDDEPALCACRDSSCCPDEHVFDDDAGQCVCGSDACCEIEQHYDDFVGACVADECGWDDALCIVLGTDELCDVDRCDDSVCVLINDECMDEVTGELCDSNVCESELPQFCECVDADVGCINLETLSACTVDCCEYCGSDYDCADGMGCRGGVCVEVCDEPGGECF